MKTTKPGQNQKVRTFNQNQSFDRNSKKKTAFSKKDSSIETKFSTKTTKPGQNQKVKTLNRNQTFDTKPKKKIAFPKKKLFN